MHRMTFRFWIVGWPAFSALFSCVPCFVPCLCGCGCACRRPPPPPAAVPAPPPVVVLSAFECLSHLAHEVVASALPQKLHLGLSVISRAVRDLYVLCVTI